MMIEARLGAAAFLRLTTLGAWVVSLLWLLGEDMPRHFRYQAFVRAELWPLLLGGLIVLLLLLVADYVRRGRRGPAGGALQRGAQSALLLLPLVYLPAAARSGLGSDAFATRSIGGRTLSGAAARSSGDRGVSDDGTVTVLQILRDTSAYVDERVTVEGMVYRGAEVPEGQFVLFRFVIMCCAADAVPAGVLVSHADANRMVSDTWVRVAGTVGRTVVEGEPAPLIRAASIERIEPLVTPYLTPW